MELKDITAKLKTIPNGANIGITYKSDISKQLNATARREGHTIEKEGRVVLRKGLKKDRDPENVPGARSWGKHSSEEENVTNGESFVIEHNGKYYIDFYVGSAGGVGIQAPKYKYFLDGKEVNKEELEPLMQPAAYKRMNAPHDHYAINIDHVIDIRYNGRRTEGLNEDCKDCVDQYERNVLNHIHELEDEGEYEAAEYFKNDFPMLIDYSETDSTITLKFNDILDKSDLEQYLMYVPKHFDENAIATARRVNGDTIVIKNNTNGGRRTEGLDEDIDSSNNESIMNEELDEEIYFDFEHEIYNALTDIIFKYSRKGITTNEVKRALDNFDIRFFEDGVEDIIEESFDDLDKSTDLEEAEKSLPIHKDHISALRRFDESLEISNESISDSDAQKYGYRNAAELKAANKLNEQ